MSKINNIEDIHKIENFNLDLLKEALRLAELKMIDENNRKERIDRRAYFILPFVLGSIIWMTKEIYQLPKDVVFKDYFQTSMLISYLLFVITAILLCCVIKPQSYGGMGRLPDIWLNSSVVSSLDNKIFGKILTKILLDSEDCIIKTYETNNKRIKILSWSLRLVLFTPLFLLVSIISHLF